jgi:hypothetical protein
MLTVLQRPGAPTNMQSENGQLGAANLHLRVVELLDTAWPAYRNSSFLDTWRIRDKIMSETGPPMLLVDPADLHR